MKDKSADPVDLLWSALCQSQRLNHMGETTGGMVHELNNGLSVVSGLLELLREKLRVGERALSAGQSSTEAAQLLALATQDLSKISEWLNTSMVSAGRLSKYTRRLSAVRTNVDVNELCAAACDESRYRCERERIVVVLDLTDDLPLVNGNPAQLLQVVANVLRNSREAYARTGAHASEGDGFETLRTIGIATYTDAKMVVIQVDDAGPGIPQELAERVFEIDCTTKEDTGAQAVSGLAVARMIARAHGGDLRLGDSPAGARFVLELPALE